MTKLRNRINLILCGKAGAVIFFFALFFIHTPYEIGILPGITTISHIVQILTVVFCLFCLVVFSNGIRRFFLDNMLLWALLVWMAVILISTLREPANIWYLYGTEYDFFINPAAIVLLIAVYAKTDIRKLIWYLFVFYLIINTLNNASALFFHNRGMWGADLVTRNKNILLVGNFNNSVENAIPSIFAGTIYSQLYDRKWVPVNFINIIYSVVAAFVFSCNAQIIICTAFGICQILCLVYNSRPGIKKGLGWLNAKAFLVFDLLVFDAVVILGNFGWMEKLGLDPRVHGRRELWDTVLERIISCPITGNGYKGWILTIINKSEKWFSHEHSIYLHFAHIGGIFGLAVLVFMIILCINNIQKINSFDIRLIYVFLFGFTFLILSVEIYRRTLIFLIFAICCYISACFRKTEPDF